MICEIFRKWWSPPHQTQKNLLGLANFTAHFIPFLHEWARNPLENGLEISAWNLAAKLQAAPHWRHHHCGWLAWEGSQTPPSCQIGKTHWMLILTNFVVGKIWENDFQSSNFRADNSEPQISDCISSSNGLCQQPRLLSFWVWVQTSYQTARYARYAKKKWKQYDII